MWADSDAAWLYMSETECVEQTATPCKPSTSPAFAPLACVARPACERQTGTPPGVPFCLVLANMNATTPLDVDLNVSGSLVPVASSGDGNGGRLGGSEIALICLGAGAGVFMWAGLMTLFSWLRRHRVTPRDSKRSLQSAQAAPLVAADAQRQQGAALLASLPAGKGLPAAPAPAAAAAAAPVPAGGSPPQLVYGTLTLLPPPGPGTAGAPPPYARGAPGPTATLQYPGQGTPRGPPPLAPLPPGAYGALGRTAHEPAGEAPPVAMAETRPPEAQPQQAQR